MEQNPGLPRARHPRRHLLAAGSRLMEYDDGNADGAKNDGADKVMLVTSPLMLNLKHAGTPCVRDR